MIFEHYGPPMAALNTKQFEKCTLDLLSEIKLISGAPIFGDDDELDAQIRVLNRFLSRFPKYRNLTAAEVTQAFYMNAAGYYPETIRHYNRELNAEFIGDVLNAYLRYKSKFLGAKLGIIQKALNPPPPPEIPVYGPEDWIRMIDHDLRLVAAGHASLVFNIGPKYRFMREKGYIRIRSRRHWWQWYGLAVQRRRDELLRTPAGTEGAKVDRKRMIYLLEDVITKGEIPAAEHRKFVGMLRRTVYLEHLEAAAACGIVNFFDQIRP